MIYKAYFYGFFDFAGAETICNDDDLSFICGARCNYSKLTITLLAYKLKNYQIYIRNKLTKNSVDMKKIAIALFAITLCGCASKLQESAWYPLRETGVSFEQSKANCEYDMEKLGLSDGRLSMAIVGLQHPTFEKCMNRYGFYWQKKK